MQVAVKQLFVYTLLRREILDLIWLREQRLRNIHHLKIADYPRFTGMKYDSAFESPRYLINYQRAYPNHIAFTEPYLTWIQEYAGR